MTDNQQIIIQLSKKKSLLTLLASLIFVVLGIVIMLKPVAIGTLLGSNITFFIGLLSVIFFGLVSLFAFRKLFDKTPGLIINHQGIVDNSSAVAVGLIAWKDIEKIERISVFGQQMLLIMVKNPHDYLNRLQNAIKHKTAQANYKHYGSPISIAATLLAVDFESLYGLLIAQADKYKN